MADVARLGGAGVPDGQLTADDVNAFNSAWASSATFQNDLVGVGGANAPDGTSYIDDYIDFYGRYFAGYTGGVGLISDAVIDNRKGYAGYEFDPVVAGIGGGTSHSKYFVRNRVFDSNVGRWLTHDPVKLPPDSLYAYVGNRAVTFNDPLGLFACATCSKMSARQPGVPGTVDPGLPGPAIECTPRAIPLDTLGDLLKQVMFWRDIRNEIINRNITARSLENEAQKCIDGGGSPMFYPKGGAPFPCMYDPAQGWEPFVQCYSNPCDLLADLEHLVNILSETKADWDSKSELGKNSCVVLWHNGGWDDYRKRLAMYEFYSEQLLKARLDCDNWKQRQPKKGTEPNVFPPQPNGPSLPSVPSPSPASPVPCGPCLPASNEPEWKFGDP